MINKIYPWRILDPWPLLCNLKSNVADNTHSDVVLAHIEND